MAKNYRILSSKNQLIIIYCAINQNNPSSNDCVTRKSAEQTAKVFNKLVLQLFSCLLYYLGEFARNAETTKIFSNRIYLIFTETQIIHTLHDNYPRFVLHFSFRRVIMFALIGYDKLGIKGNDGIRYAWRASGSSYYVESAAFITHTKGSSDNISGYTTSVSSGCILKSMKCPCVFCRTGQKLPFSRLLTAKEIALQNVLMVLCDMYYPVKQCLIEPKREFAYMGQGEPGFSYPQVRNAIQITNHIMQKLNQRVHRHILATSGVSDMIHLYIDDYRNGIFRSEVTLHFSLHLTEFREKLMPVEGIYSYTDIITALYKAYDVTHLKPCIGILLFNQYRPSGKRFSYTNDFHRVKLILETLDPKRIRLSFCELNDSEQIGKSQAFPLDEANRIIQYARSIGFEAKYFSSFGKEELSACGMLAGKEPSCTLNQQYFELQSYAHRLVEEASCYVHYNTER